MIPGVTHDFDYDNRVVLFLDILGWRSHIAASVDDRALRQRLAEIAELLESVSGDYYRGHREDGRAIAQFSDSLVLSLNWSTYSIRAILRYTRFLCRALLERGFVARGGIADGLLHHRGPILFGPALVEAYDLEQRVARVPRVVLTDGARGSAEIAENAFDGEGRWLGADRMVRKDTDGVWFVDYLCADRVFSFREPWDATPDEEVEEDRQNEAIRAVLVQIQQDAGGNPGIAAKHRWLVDYYNSVTPGRRIEG